jgi:hypothetical protein
MPGRRWKGSAASKLLQSLNLTAALVQRRVLAGKEVIYFHTQEGAARCGPVDGYEFFVIFFCVCMLFLSMQLDVDLPFPLRT